MRNGFLNTRRTIGAAVAAFFVAAAGVTAGLVFAQGGETIIRDGQGYTCRGSVNIDLLKVTNAGTSDSVNLRDGCTGRIGRLELGGLMTDGVKVNNGSPRPHDIVIEGGYIFADGAPAGAHQDCVQALNGNNISFRNVALDNAGAGGGGCWFLNSGTNITCTHCAFGPNHPNGVRGTASNYVKDSLICQPLSGRAAINAPADAGGNIIAPIGDPRCTRAGLLAWASSGEPPPDTTDTTTESPTTTTDPPPPATCDQVCVDAYEAQVAALEADVVALTATLVVRDATIVGLEAKVAEWVAWHAEAPGP